MRRSTCHLVLSCLILTGLCLSCQSFRPPKITEVPPEPVNPLIEVGQQVAEQYATGRLMDYEVVWRLYDLDPNERGPFLDGFVQAFTDAGNPTKGMEYRVLLIEATSGNQFRMAVDLGSKHAAKAVTNEQIQGVVRSSLGVSEAVALEGGLYPGLCRAAGGREGGNGLGQRGDDPAPAQRGGRDVPRSASRRRTVRSTAWGENVVSHTSTQALA